jgi:hypothetical protein
MSRDEPRRGLREAEPPRSRGRCGK